jgi:Tc5 transposase DNA-binding domain
VKNIRSAKLSKLEEALLLFIHQMRDRKFPISRALVNAKAKEYAAELGNISITLSKTFHS